MATRSDVEELRKRRRERRLDDIASGASLREKRTPAEKLDAADALIRDAWSLHDAAKEKVVRRRR